MNYVKTTSCHTGEVDGYGYAFVAGDENGVVLLDLRTKRLLDDLSLFELEHDERRIDLLLERNLIHPRGKSLIRLPIPRDKIKSIGVWLHVTNNCNLDCGYCYIKKDKCAMTIETARLFMEKLEDTIKQHGIEFVELKFAGGEPTMNKEVVLFIADIVQKRLIDKGVQVRLRLITNGTLLNFEWIDIIKKYSMGFCISLDGIGEWNDVNRSFVNGRGSFAIIDRNLRMCMDEGLQPGILTTITEKNIDGVHLLSKYLIDSNMRFRYAFYRDNAGDYAGHESFVDQLMIPLNDCYEYYAQEIREGRADFSHQLADIHLDRKPHYKACNVGFSGLVVNHLGEMFFVRQQ